MTIKICILAVDDGPISLKILTEHLESLGYSVEAVSSGKIAWELLQRYPEKYAVVIVDRMMEGIDGMQLLRYIKSTAALKNIPVIIQTGEADAEDFIAAVKAGVFDFIYKPLEQKLLMYVIKNAINKDLLDKQTSFKDF